MSIAFLGTGLMGQPMAARLIRSGLDVTVWNRTREKTAPLLALGAHDARSPTQAVSQADIVILVLYDANAVSELLFDRDVSEAVPHGALVVDMATSSPESARDHARRLEPLGIHYLDAPVSGGTRGAAGGTLAIMVGGAKADFERAQPVLSLMGRPTHVGPTGSGQLAKCANQVIVAITIGAVAEALLLAERDGADPAAVREALLGGFADSRILREHGRRMIDREFTPGGTAQTQVKDLNIILDVARRLGLDLPLTERVTDLFEALAGHAPDLDHSALLLELERRNAAAQPAG